MKPVDLGAHLLTPIRYADPVGDKKLYLAEDLWAIDRGEFIYVPSCLSFDGASVPWLARGILPRLYNRYRVGAIVHDAAYKGLWRRWLVENLDYLESSGWCVEEERTDADNMFKDFNKLVGVSDIRNFLLYSAVANFGKKAFLKSHARWKKFYPEERAAIAAKWDITVKGEPPKTVPDEIVQLALQKGLVSL